MLSVVDNVFVEADSRLQFVPQQINLVEETGRRAATIGQKWSTEGGHLLTELTGRFQGVLSRKCASK